MNIFDKPIKYTSYLNQYFYWKITFHKYEYAVEKNSRWFGQKQVLALRLKKTRDARYRRNKRERIIDIGIQCDRWRRVKEATGIEKDEKMMEILIDA